MAHLARRLLTKNSVKRAWNITAICSRRLLPLTPVFRESHCHEMQAAPQAGNASVEQAIEAFARSIREIAGWDWSCDLVLEHCDAMTGPAPRKGFYP